MTNFPTANNKQATPTKLMTKTNELGDDVGLHTLSRVVRVQMAWMTIERIANLKLQIKGVFCFVFYNSRCGQFRCKLSSYCGTSLIMIAVSSFRWKLSYATVVV